MRSFVVAVTPAKQQSDVVIATGNFDKHPDAIKTFENLRGGIYRVHAKPNGGGQISLGYFWHTTHVQALDEKGACRPMNLIWYRNI